MWTSLGFQLNRFGNPFYKLLLHFYWIRWLLECVSAFTEYSHWTVCACDCVSGDEYGCRIATTTFRSKRWTREVVIRFKKRCRNINSSSRVSLSATKPSEPKSTGTTTSTRTRIILNTYESFAWVEIKEQSEPQCSNQKRICNWTNESKCVFKRTISYIVSGKNNISL